MEGREKEPPAFFRSLPQLLSGPEHILPPPEVALPAADEEGHPHMDQQSIPGAPPPGLLGIHLGGGGGGGGAGDLGAVLNKQLLPQQHQHGVGGVGPSSSSFSLFSHLRDSHHGAGGGMNRGSFAQQPAQGGIGGPGGDHYGKLA